MVEIFLTQLVNATPKQLLELLVDHVGLAKFFNAKFVIVRPADDGEIAGGKGCQRQVTSLGNTFVEEIHSANEQGIDYHIVGDKPLKNHHGVISFSAQGESTLISYKIVGKPPFWQPTFIVQWLIKRDIANALANIESHFSH